MAWLMRRAVEDPFFTHPWCKPARNYPSISGVTGGGGAGGAECPQRLLTGKFLLTYREKEARKKREKGWKLRIKEEKLYKGRCEIENGIDFFPFSFKTTKICFGCTKMGIFYLKKAFYAGKKNQEKWLCPLRKKFLLRPCLAWNLLLKE